MTEKKLKNNFSFAHDPERTVVNYGVDGVNSEVRLGTARIGRKNVFLAEKIPKPGTDMDFFTRQHVKKGERLKEIGLSALPTIRVVTESDGRKRLFVTDLSQGGKFEVSDYEDNHGRIVVGHLQNIGEIKDQIERENELAAENGIWIDEKSWHVQIDPRKKTGKPFLSDLKRFLLLKNKEAVDQLRNK